MQIHDVVFITIFVTFFVGDVGFVGVIVVVSVVVVVDVVVVGVVVVGVVFEVAKHDSGLVLGFFHCIKTERTCWDTGIVSATTEIAEIVIQINGISIA